MNSINIDFMFIVQTIIILLLFAVVIYFIKYNKSLKLEKRIEKYSIPALVDKNISLFDKISDRYYKTMKVISRMLKKNKLLVKYSKKYIKYINYNNKKSLDEMDYISNKFVISFAFLFIDLFARSIEGSYPGVFEVIAMFVLGFFIIDIWFIFEDIVKKRQVEQELLNAIIIMNNAFRSGRSTIQAIEIVSKELDGPIKEEFQKMHIEISYGLSLDTVFERFGKRVDLEEVKYITSSLTILNKTGGNIIKVFASIEKSLFNKKKLAIELKTLTASSNMISKMLLVIPFIFGGLIYLINNTYFNPFFTSNIGKVLFGFIIIDYILYAYAINKIMKVRL